MTLKKTAKGFTLIEILIVIGIIAILAAIVIVAINPAKQFAQARNTQRESNVNTILNAIGQRIADNKGTFAGTFTIGTDSYTCPALPTTAKTISDTDDADEVDLNCLFPTYIPAQIPVDPKGGTTYFWTDETDYFTGYTVETDSAGRVEVCAPQAGVETSVPSPAAICVTR
jgi:prepilin-type N-terminal cleavage/methylation domain-containing protein